MLKVKKDSNMNQVAQKMGLVATEKFGYFYEDGII